MLIASLLVQSMSAFVALFAFFRGKIPAASVYGIIFFTVCYIIQNKKRTYANASECEEI